MIARPAILRVRFIPLSSLKFQACSYTSGAPWSALAGYDDDS
jgi:hypothetical protein